MKKLSEKGPVNSGEKLKVYSEPSSSGKQSKLKSNFMVPIIMNFVGTSK